MIETMIMNNITATNSKLIAFTDQGRRIAELAASMERVLDE
jgi:hypothetical protein